MIIIPAKLSIPETKSRLFPREHLSILLNEGLNCRITLMAAGAGYGKSTLLSEWAKRLPLFVSWISLDQHDNEELLFWEHIIVALEPLLPERDIFELLDMIEQHQDRQSLISVLINALHRVSEEFVMILDDFHLIENASIVNHFSALLERLPNQVHVYMTSRSTIPVRVSKLRLQGQLIEIDQEDLRLREEEVAVFFRECADVRIDTETCINVLNKTEGWITGMRLIAISMESFIDESKDTKDTMVHFSPGASYFMRYFVEEVLQKQRKELQQFLMQTSVLDRINVRLAEAVTGLVNVSSILKELEEKNLFLVSLDANKEWYRYHHLFQEFLRTHWSSVDPVGIRQAHLLAGEWLYDHDYLEEAIDQFLIAQDYEKVMQLLENMMKMTPVHKMLGWHRWIKDIPNHQLVNHRELYLLHLSCLYFSRDQEQVLKKYWWAYNYLQSDRHGMDQQAVRYFEAGLDFLVAFSAYFEYNVDDFIVYTEKYLNTYPQGELLINFGMDQDGYHLAWEVWISEYDLSKSKVWLKKLLHLWKHTRNELFYAHLCLDYSNMHYEKNALAKAEKYADIALGIAQTHQNDVIEIQSYLMLAQVHFANKYLEKMQAQLAKAIEIAQEINHTLYIKRAVFLKNELDMKTGKTDGMGGWLQHSQVAADDALSNNKLEIYEMLARYLGMDGNFEAALRLTKRLLSLVNMQEEKRNYIRIHLLIGMLHHEKGAWYTGFQALEKALTVACEAGFIRTIIDAGWKMGALLEAFVQAVQHHHYPLEDKRVFDYAKDLLDLFIREKGDGQPVKIETLLTLKEQIVLMYIKDGKTNRKIAEALNVSLATVKTHINHLYRKLDVNNRVMALQKAEELGLLEENRG